MSTVTFAYAPRQGSQGVEKAGTMSQAKAAPWETKPSLFMGTLRCSSRYKRQLKNSWEKEF